MKKLFIFTVLLFAAQGVALAGSLDDITFPIPELGDCKNKEACRIYCDEAENLDACLDFAEEHGLISDKEAEHARRGPVNGPGGCDSENTCHAYCEEESHFNECISFGVREGYMTQEEAELARKFHNQAGPGGCRGDEECRTYCEDAAHIEECINFAEENGFMTRDDAARAREHIERSEHLRDIGGPGGCEGEEECRTYCEAPGHIEECLEFGIREGFITSQEAARIRHQIKQGGKIDFDEEGPGGCVGHEACFAYCEDPANGEACLRFAEENNLLSSKDLEEMRRGLDLSRTGGPGGCRGEKECQAYCEDPVHIEECISFAEENGFITRDEAERSRKFQRALEEGPIGCRGKEGKDCRDYCERPQNHKACFEFARRNGLLSEEEIEHFEQGERIGLAIKESGGPGGCNDDQSCFVYCSDPVHTEECVAFTATKGGISPEKARELLEEFRREGGREGPEHGGPPLAFPEGPGGCSTPEECINFCSDPLNRDECARFRPQGPDPGDFPPGGTFRQDPPPGFEGEFDPNLRDLDLRSPEERDRFCNEHPEECRDGGLDLFGEPQFSPTDIGGEQVLCTQEFRPVCGNDGRTYSNPCHARVANAEVSYPGECKSDDGTTGTFDEPQVLPSEPRVEETFGCSDEYRPVCGNDGRTYHNSCKARVANAEVAYPGECRSLEQKREFLGGNVLSAFLNYLSRVFYSLSL